MLVAIDRTIRWCQVGFVPATMQNGAISGDSQIADMVAGRILGSFGRNGLVNACELPDGFAGGCSHQGLCGDARAAKRKGERRRGITRAAQAGAGTEARGYRREGADPALKPGGAP